MKICILNDTHAGNHNSSEIFLDNADTFYNETLFPYLNDNNIKHIVHLGDYFDNRKFINFKALNRNRQSFLSKLRTYGITMDINSRDFVTGVFHYYANLFHLTSQMI